MRTMATLAIAALLAGCGGGEPEAGREVAAPARMARAAAMQAAAPADAWYRVRQPFPSPACLAPEGAVAEGSPLAWRACDDSNDAQLFAFVASAGPARGVLRHRASSLCATAQEGALVLRACDAAGDSLVTWRDDGAGAMQVHLPHIDPRSEWTARLHRLVPGAPASWQPAVTDTWQWQLTGTINTGYDVAVYDIDLFDTPQAVIDGLKAAGRRVVCYFSAGSSEDWRDDFGDFDPSDMGEPLDGWPGERWLDTRSAKVRAIMKARLDHAVARGCDGVEPDNMDAYLNGPGLPLTRATQLDYNRFIGDEARARGLRVGLKNAVDLLEELEPHFDFAVNEQCHQYEECGGYSVFTSRGKPVFNAEYASKWRTDPVKRAQLCEASRAIDIRTLVLPVDLDDSFRFTCD